VEAWIFIATGLAVLAGTLIVPFMIGLVRGPAASRAALDPSGEKSMRPLSRLADLYGRFLALAGFGVVVSFATGHRGSVCASTPGVASGAPAGYPARAGAVIHGDGVVQACAAHPSTAQWVLDALMRLPGPLLLATVLLLIWQLVREAGRNGPFTARTAGIMWRLGLVVLIGTAVAGALGRLGTDLLLQMLVQNPPFGDAPGLLADVVLGGPLHALLPVPALAGAGLLTFARITRAGVALDEEVRATV
jgi:hypothetical protein